MQAEFSVNGAAQYTGELVCFLVLVPFLLFEQKSDDKEPLSELRILNVISNFEYDLIHM